MVLKIAGHYPESRVSVNNVAPFVNEQSPIGIAVESDAHVCLVPPHLSLELIEMKRAAVQVYVVAVRLRVYYDEIAAKIGKYYRSQFRCGPIGAIDDKLHAAQREAVAFVL